MAFFQSITTWLDEVEAANCARVAARTARAQAAVEAKVASKTSLDNIASQLRMLNADMITSHIIHFMIMFLLVLNFLALIGLVITITPALSNERDYYVTPAVKTIIPVLAGVKSLYLKAATIVTSSITAVKYKATGIKTSIVAGITNAQAEAETKVKEWKKSFNVSTESDAQVALAVVKDDTEAELKTPAEPALEGEAEGLPVHLLADTHQETKAEEQDDGDSDLDDYDIIDEDPFNSDDEGVHGRLPRFIN